MGVFSKVTSTGPHRGSYVLQPGGALGFCRRSQVESSQAFLEGQDDAERRWGSPEEDWLTLSSSHVWLLTESGGLGQGKLAAIP